MAASQSSPRPIVVVTGGGQHVWAMINAIADRVGPVSVVLETPESKKQLLIGRARRQGWISAIGQLGTMVLSRLGKRFLVSHTARLIAEEKLETEPRRDQEIIHVASANGPECLEAIQKLQPGVVLLNGCRLLSKDMLARMPCPVLNYHAGITPKYRGMNGGYWALTSGDRQNFGTTVHLVDPGVDTGAVLKQVRGQPKRGDTISSYALRQTAFSLDICVEAVSDVLAGKLATFDPGLPSRQWYHPTIWFYVWTGIRTGIW
ncbi:MULTISPECIES: formyl transferase [Mesorhizobium]|uniref:formyl transferase n=1 Tax=Mesorhizobium TaxID=68287 RepID=UPI0003CF5883|nr:MULTISPECIES: formyl transferase [Mesorhizobium]ESY70861.1 formyl transferase [Mesorhizobium sp. LNHC232B00]WJI41087.1 formyl transferase [Mesorhizobium opportunistum]